jgi:hypothetical protein
MDIDDRVVRLLARTEAVMHPDKFMIVSIDRSEIGKVRLMMKDLGVFSSITFAQSEVSLIVEAGTWEHLRKGFIQYKEEGPYKLITFDLVLELSIVGYLSAISARLAKAGVSIFALSTFLRDHILVKAREAERAMKTIAEFILECRDTQFQVKNSR